MRPKVLFSRKLFILLIPFLFGPLLVLSQDGGDRATPLVGTFYDRLRRPNTGNIFVQFLQSSKGLGVYNLDQQPSSLLEVNSTNNYYNFLHPNINTRGELLRTTAPGNVTANWRFFHGAGNQVGRFC